MWLKPNGISVLLSAMNEENTIRMSVESFLNFADEIIIVTNGSTDGTRNLCKELVNENPKKLFFYDKPELPDLYHNRAFALSKAKYRWVMRADADFIAYNDEDGEEYSIMSLREIILNHKTYWPTLFVIGFVNLFYNYKKIGKKREYQKISDRFDNGIYVPLPITKMGKIYLNTPILKFKRIGRSEGAPYLRLYKRIEAREKPYIFHVTIKKDKDLFYRSERTNWREIGDYDKYPYLEDYIKKYVLPKKYKMNEEEAIKTYIKVNILPFLTDYNESEYYVYPKAIIRYLENEDIQY